MGKGLNMYGMSGMMANENIAKAYAACMTSVIEANKQRAEMLKELAAKQEAAQKAQQAEALDQLEKQEELEEEQLLEATTKKETVAKYEDSEDGGKTLTWWGKVKNFGKGAINTVKGMFCDENGFSLKRTLTTVAVGAGCIALTVATGGAAAPFLVGAGVAMGAVHAGKGIYKVATAKNAAEEAAGWQDIGGGTFEVVASAAGAKGALKMAGRLPVPKGGLIKGTFRAGKDCFIETANGAYKVARHPFKSGKSVKNYFAKGGEGRANWNKAFKSKNAKANQQAELKAKYNNKIADLKKQKADIEAKIAELSNDAAKNAKEIKAQNEKLTSIENDIASQESLLGKVTEKTTAQADNTKAAVEANRKLNKEIGKLNKKQEKLDNIINDSSKSKKAVDRAKAEKAANEEKLVELNKQKAQNAEATSVGARKNRIEELNNNIKELEGKLKKAKKENKAEIEQQIKAAKEEIKIQEKLIKTEEAELKIAKAKAEANENAAPTKKEFKAAKKELEKAQKELENAIREAESDVSTATEQAAVNRAKNNLNELNARAKKAGEVKTETDKLIAEAEAQLRKINTIAAFNKFGRPNAIPFAAATAGTEGILFGNTVTPGTEEVTLKAENQEELLEQLKEAQEARRKQVAASFNKQSQINPFQLAQAFMPQSSGIDSLALYQSPFPNIM